MLPPVCTDGGCVECFQQHYPVGEDLRLVTGMATLYPGDRMSGARTDPKGAGLSTSTGAGRVKRYATFGSARFLFRWEQYPGKRKVI